MGERRLDRISGREAIKKRRLANVSSIGSSAENSLPAGAPYS